MEKSGVDRNLLHYVSSILRGLRFFFCLHFSDYVVFLGGVHKEECFFFCY